MPPCRRRDDRRDLQAVPRQGDHRDPPPRARDRGGGRRGLRRAADRAPARRRSSCSSTGRRRRSSRRGRLPRPGRRRDHQVAGAAPRRRVGGVRDELRQVRRRRRGRVAAEWLRRELRIVAAEARRRDGRRRARVRERARLPALAAAREHAGRAAALHADDRGARRPGHRLVARRAARRRPRSGTPSSPSAPGGPRCRRTSGGDLRGAVRLRRRLLAAVERRPVVGRRLDRLRPAAGDVRARPARPAAPPREVAAARRVLRSPSSPPCSTVVHANVLANFASLGAATLLGWCVPSLLRGALVGRARRVRDPVGRRVLGLARADEADRRAPRARLHGAVVRVSRSGRARGCEPRPARPALLRPLPRRRGAFRLRVLPTWLALVASLGATIALTVWLDLSGLPALPGIALGFLLPNADLLWRRLRGQPRLADGTDVPGGGAAHDL